jgi:hypothetical protein
MDMQEYLVCLAAARPQLSQSTKALRIQLEIN